MKRNLTHYLYLPFLLLLCCTSLSVRAHAMSNNTLIERQTKLSDLSAILDQIAEVYQVSIIYDVEQIEKLKVSNWTLSNQSVEVELKRVLKGLNAEYKKLDEKTYVVKEVQKSTTNSQNVEKSVDKVIIQEVTVKGIVKDADSNEALIGVNILEKDGDKGTVTDYDGSFTLTVEQGTALVFSYIGYEDLEVIASQADLGTILLAEASSLLKEVVVVGYGTSKRSDLTGSLSSVGEKELKALPATGLDQALQGRAAGVFVTQNSGAPGGAVSVRIRGIASTLSAEPLYVIDGVPVQNDNSGTSSNFQELDGGGQNSNALNTINPSDIESIEVLKDASATAIYGSRGANGVVLITTKRGEEGQSNLSFETYYGVQELSKKVPVMNLREYAEYFNDTRFEMVEEFQNLDLLGAGTDWQDAVFRTANQQNYQMTASGGSSKTKYAMSLNYNTKEGIVVGSNFTRMSGKLNLDHSVNDKVRLGSSFMLARTRENITFNDNSSGVIYTALLMVPSAPVRNVDGTFAGPQEEITLPFDNPVARALDTDDVNRKTRALSNLYLEVDLLPSLKYRTEFGTDIVYSNHNTFFPSFERGSFFGKSGVRRSLNNSFFWINKHLLNFNKTIAKKHTIGGLLGFEAQEGQFEWLYAARNNLPNNELQQLSLGDAGQQENGGGAGHWALLSYFGRLNYNFNDKYLLTGTFRADGSSRFGPENRYGYFPSGAIAWRASNEDFLKGVDVLDNLKFRAGVGLTGNQEIGLYSFRENLRNNNIVLGNQLITALGPDNIANPGVKWESSFQTNFGVDIGLVKNRIELIVDVYRRKNEDMLLPALLPATAGSLNPPFVNIGEIRNNGYEVSLNTTNITGPFTWRSTVNFTQNRNEVIDLGTTGALTGSIQRVPVTRTVEGMPISMFYGYVTDGLFQTQAEVVESPFQSTDTRAGDIKFKDLNSDGIINEQDQTFIGSPIPDFTLNMTHTLEWKNFDMNLFVQGVYGNEILNIMRRDIEGMSSNGNQVVAAIDRWTSLNPGNEVPRATGSDPNNNRRVSDRFIEDGSFIRIKNITLGYNVPKSTLRRWKVKSLRLYASTQNLMTWTNYSGYDPEIGSFNQNPLINGVENGRYPISRNYTVGLNVNF